MNRMLFTRYLRSILPTTHLYGGVYCATVCVCFIFLFSSFLTYKFLVYASSFRLLLRQTTFPIAMYQKHVPTFRLISTRLAGCWSVYEIAKQTNVNVTMIRKQSPEIGI